MRAYALLQIVIVLLSWAFLVGAGYLFHLWLDVSFGKVLIIIFGAAISKLIFGLIFKGIVQLIFRDK